MPEITGTLLLVQEGRLRLVTEDGRGRAFLLAPEAPVPQASLAGLEGRRVRLGYAAEPKLKAGVVTEIGPLP